jgi:hypothetical protein
MTPVAIAGTQMPEGGRKVRLPSVKRSFEPVGR